MLSIAWRYARTSSTGTSCSSAWSSQPPIMGVRQSVCGKLSPLSSVMLRLTRAMHLATWLQPTNDHALALSSRDLHVEVFLKCYAAKAEVS